MPLGKCRGAVLPEANLDGLCVCRTTTSTGQDGLKNSTNQLYYSLLWDVKKKMDSRDGDAATTVAFLGPVASYTHQVGHGLWDSGVLLVRRNGS